jgi:hypothetical protein
MCLPAAVVGIVTAVTSAVSTIAQFTAQQAEAQQANAAAQAQYQAQMAAYRQSEQAYKSQMDLNAQAANRAYVQEQQKLKFEYDKAALEASELLASSMRTQGTLLASGRTGQSIGVLANDADREYSRDLATLGLNLAYAGDNYLTSAYGAQQQWESANNLAASQRMLEPSKPMKIGGPSPLGLIGGLLGAGLSGYNAYTSLKPLQARTEKPTTPPKQPPKTPPAPKK